MLLFLIILYQDLLDFSSMKNLSYGPDACAVWDTGDPFAVYKEGVDKTERCHIPHLCPK